MFMFSFEVSQFLLIYNSYLTYVSFLLIQSTQFFQNNCQNLGSVFIMRGKKSKKILNW